MCKTHSVQSLHRATQMKGPYTHAHKTDFFRRYGPTKATVKSMASQTEETMYIVDRGASLHMIGFSSPTCSDRQESTSRRLALLCRYIWRRCSPSPLLLGRSCNELGYSVCAWPAGGTHRLSIGKKVIDCGIENFVSVEVPDKKWYHPKKFHQPWVTESWREMWSTPYWNC